MTFSLILSHYLLFISILFDAVIFNAASIISLDKYVLHVPCHLAFFFKEFSLPSFFLISASSNFSFLLSCLLLSHVCISYIKY